MRARVFVTLIGLALVAWVLIDLAMQIPQR